jgi:hypothetical protein
VSDTTIAVTATATLIHYLFSECGLEGPEVVVRCARPGRHKVIKNLEYVRESPHEKARGRAGLGPYLVAQWFAIEKTAHVVFEEPVQVPEKAGGIGGAMR